MGINICALQEKRLVDRIRSLKIKGEVIKKKDGIIRRPVKTKVLK